MILVYELIYSVAKNSRIKLYFTHPENVSRKYFREALEETITYVEQSSPADEILEEKFVKVVEQIKSRGFEQIEKVDYMLKKHNNKLYVDYNWGHKQIRKNY